ncbi:MAG: serine/threonine protein kinase, partial [Pseudomonadota bacterium]
MDHPNVARVLDGGVTPMGGPYFVMEHVKGEPITAFADRHRLTIKQRLELFIPVCEAVQHAHHKGLIHRDLTPSNVLVVEIEGRAVPKVIDFGIAKAAGKATKTQAGILKGKFGYMSPEQIRGLPLDRRSDVFAIG